MINAGTNDNLVACPIIGNETLLTENINGESATTSTMANYTCLTAFINKFGSKTYNYQVGKVTTDNNQNIIAGIKLINLGASTANFFIEGTLTMQKYTEDILTFEPSK